jgi:hypothetical protein
MDKVLSWVKNQPEKRKNKMGEIIFEGHNHQHEMANFSATTDMSLVMKGSIAELRDFNRHRAWGRFIQLPLLHGLPIDIDTVKQILGQGYVLPTYLTEVPEFADLRKKISRDLGLYYETLYSLLEVWEGKFGDSVDYSFVLNLLPFAHQTNLWMHGNPKQASYLTKLRVRNGGQITYRVMAWEAARLIAQSDPYLSSIKIDKRPNAASRKEFFDRS